MKFLIGSFGHLLPEFIGLILLCSVGACTPFSLGRPAAHLQGDPGDEPQQNVQFVDSEKNAGLQLSSVVSGEVNESTRLQVDNPGRLPAFERKDDPAPVLKGGNYAPDDVVILDYEQVALRQILEDLSDALGISVVIDSSISQKVTLRTSSRHSLHKKDLWPLLRLLLSDAGVTFEKKGGVYHAKREPSAIPPIVTMGRDRSTPGIVAPRVLQIFPLRHIAAEVALPLLKPLIKATDKIISLPNTNLLGVAASPDYLERVGRLIELVDVDPFKARGIRLYYLQNAKAKEAANDLGKIIKLVEGPRPAYQVMGIERINALLVTAPPERGFVELSKWVQILDTDQATDREQIFIYKVKHLSAKSLASTLTSVFKRDKKIVPPGGGGSANSAGGDVKTQQSGKTGNQGGVEKSTVAVSASKQPSSQTTSANLIVKVVADEDTNSLLIKATAADYRQLMETIYTLDKAPLEVMVNIVIAEINLTKNSEYGIDWSLLSKYGDGLLGTSFDVTKDALGVATGQTNRNILETGFEVTGTLNDGGLTLAGVGGGRLAAVMNLLAKDSNLQVLARPSILVKNNQEAIIKVGAEEPILTTVSNSTTQVAGTTGITNDVQYRDTGITLTVTPHINEDGIINLEVHQVVSNLGENRTVFDLPSFTNTEVRTSAIVKDKSAIILGGIIQSRDQFSKTGIPGLMNIPFVGSLFSKTTNSIGKSELVLIIVPEIVDLDSDNSAAMKRHLASLQNLKNLLESADIDLPIQ